jgi:hypothetical protein
MSEGHEPTDEEYWRRVSELLARRRWSWLWFPISIAVLVPGTKILKSAGLHPRVLVIVVAIVGTVLVARAMTAKCPKCGDTFFLRGFYRNPFTNQCLNCGHRIR